jgi:hypothetical protein
MATTNQNKFCITIYENDENEPGVFKGYITTQNIPSSNDLLITSFKDSTNAIELLQPIPDELDPLGLTPNNVLQKNPNGPNGNYYHFTQDGTTIQYLPSGAQKLDNIEGNYSGGYYNLTGINNGSFFPDAQDSIRYKNSSNECKNVKRYIKIKECEHPICFNKNTKILCINDKLEEEYRLVQDLMIGDIVKSYKNGNRPILGILNGFFINNPKINGKCMFKMIKTDDNQLTEDLIVTGNHSILVDERSEEEEKRNPKWANHKIDDKYRVVSSVSNKFERITDNNQYIYYHFSLKTDDNKDRPFGVWANGLLVECTTNGVVNKFNT